MRTITILLGFLLIQCVTISQNFFEDSLTESIDSLNNVLEENNRLIDSLIRQNEKLDFEILRLSSERNKILNENASGEEFICLSNSNIYEKSTLNVSPVVATLKRGDRVKMMENVDEYFYKVYFNGIVGYVFKSGLKSVNDQRTSEEIRNDEAKKLEQKRIEREEQEQFAIQHRAEKLIQKYGKTDGMKIFDGLIWIGMTKEMLIESWGYPNDINRTVTENVVSEQFVYGSKYVYVENGKITAWQD